MTRTLNAAEGQSTVSVVIPSYNSRRWIAAAVESALDQNSEDVRVEVIVVDDGSRDDSAEMIRRAYDTVRLIVTPNRGPSSARNTGIAAATGEFIQFLDADDVLPRAKIVAQIQQLNNTGAAVAYCDWRKSWLESAAFSEGDVVSRTIHGDPAVALLWDSWWPIHAYLFRRDLVERVGGFDNRYAIIQDAHFVVTCALHGAPFCYVPGPVVEYRMHSVGQNSRRDPIAFVRDCFDNARDAEAWWEAHGGVSAERVAALVSVYAYVARSAFEHDPETFAAALVALRRWRPHYVPVRPRHLAAAATILGYERAEYVALWYRRAKAFARRAIGGVA